MNKMEAFYQAIYDANRGTKEKTYPMDSTTDTRGLKELLERNHHVREVTTSRKKMEVYVTFK